MSPGIISVELWEACDAKTRVLHMEACALTTELSHCSSQTFMGKRNLQWVPYRGGYTQISLYSWGLDWVLQR